MAFKQKYVIRKDYLSKGSMKRPGNKIKVRFLVAHDTGNPGSTANGNVSYYKRVQNQDYASAQLFTDDKEIVECIPALTDVPERAYHVIYNVTTDNKLFGVDANDAAVGVELCWGKGIDSAKAYAKYVWTLAYLCYKFDLDPKRDIVGHDTLDPKRKVDPGNALKFMGKNFTTLITDVVAEYKECSGQSTPAPQAPSIKEGVTHKVVTGDTLWGLSQKYGTTVDRLKVLNPELDVLALRVGDIILVTPKGSIATPPPSQAPITHIIASGDTLSFIAKKYGTTVARLEQLNPSVKPNALQIKQSIVVGYQESTVTPPVNVPNKPKVDSKLEEYLKHPPIRPYPGKPVGLGAKGKDVEAIQRALKLSVDGSYGNITVKAVKEYQKKFPFLEVDGWVGYNTWNVMF